MIVLSEAQIYGFKFLEELREFNRKNEKVKVYTFFHGSFSVILPKHKVAYATDIDVDCWMYYQNNKEDLLEHGLSLIYFLLSKKFYFNETKCGDDERFALSASIQKNGNIINYDAKKIRNQFKKLHTTKIITENDLDIILEYVIDKPTLISFEKLKRVLTKYITIYWSLDDLKKGYTVHYKKKFYLKNMFMKYVMQNTFIYEYKPGSYILFDIPFRVFDIPDEYVEKMKNKEDPELYNILNAHSMLYGENDKTDTIYLYHGIFKNYVQGKYFKMLKRIRSLATAKLYDRSFKKNNMNQKIGNQEFKPFLKKIRFEIADVTKSLELSCLNQLKNRCDIIVALIEFKYKDELEIKRLVVDLMKDAMYACNYVSPDIKNVYDALKTFHLNNSNNNKNKLINAIKLFKKNMFEHLNMKALPYLIKFYNELKSKDLLVFDLILPLPNKDKI